jgi:hypothetical protein
MYFLFKHVWYPINADIQDVPGEKLDIMGSHSISHSKQESVYVHVSRSKQFPE